MNMSAAEALHGVAVGRELHDDVELAVETLVAEFFRRRIAAQHGPDVPAVDIDVDVADGADLPAARQLGPAFDLAVRIRQRLRVRGCGAGERGECADDDDDGERDGDDAERVMRGLVGGGVGGGGARVCGGH